jgi:DNA-binding NarL/FixJ family response regulator
LKEIILQKIMAEKISVLLVDDHSLVRRGFRRMLEDEEDIHVVGEASDGEEAVKLAKSLKPQVIVMDCALPGISGLQATRKILQQAPGTLILMLSMHAEETWVRQAMDAGARGYVLKNAMDLELGSAIRRMLKGETVLDGQLSREQNLKGERNSGLTPREVEILQLICDGKSNKEIAVQLELSANTVAVHRANIMDALGIHKTAELVVYAIRNGLVNIP